MQYRTSGYECCALLQLYFGLHSVRYCGRQMRGVQRSLVPSIRCERKRRRHRAIERRYGLGELPAFRQSVRLACFISTDS